MGRALHLHDTVFVITGARAIATSFAMLAAFGCGDPGPAFRTTTSALRVDRAEVDFGLRAPGCPAHFEAVRVINDGAATLEVTASVTGDAFDLPEQSGEVRLGPGEGVNFLVTLRTVSEGESRGTFTVQDERSGVRVEVRLVARTQARVTDVIFQAERPRGDLLFVMDRSASMTEEQLAIEQNLVAFSQYLRAMGLDFHLGVTSLDAVRTEGRLFPLDPAEVPVVLDESTQDLEVELVSRALGTEAADGTERGLEATWLALSGPHARAHNAGFLREGAFLSVIAVTDTIDLSERSVNDWIDDLRAIAGFRRTNMVSVSAIVGDHPGGCSGPGGHASASPRWIAAARATGGVFQSICSADWSRSLEDLTTAAFSSKFKRWLSALPASPPTVRVNGAQIPATSGGGTVNWTIDSTVPAIVFSPFATPEPGARIEVDYAIACDWRG